MITYGEGYGSGEPLLVHPNSLAGPLDPAGCPRLDAELIQGSRPAVLHAAETIVQMGQLVTADSPTTGHTYRYIQYNMDQKLQAQHDTPHSLGSLLWVRSAENDYTFTVQARTVSEAEAMVNPKLDGILLPQDPGMIAAQISVAIQHENIIASSTKPKPPLLDLKYFMFGHGLSVITSEMNSRPGYDNLAYPDDIPIVLNETWRRLKLDAIVPTPFETMPGHEDVIMHIWDGEQIGHEQVMAITGLVRTVASGRPLHLA